VTNEENIIIRYIGVNGTTTASMTFRMLIIYRHVYDPDGCRSRISLRQCTPKFD